MMDASCWITSYDIHVYYFCAILSDTRYDRDREFLASRPVMKMSHGL